jgi:hypothetical protein
MATSDSTSVTDTIRTDARAWREGVNRAQTLLDEAHEIGLCETGLEPNHRDGRPQKNIVARHLAELRELNDPRVDAAFGAVLSDFIASFVDSYLEPDEVDKLTRWPIAAEVANG